MLEVGRRGRPDPEWGERLVAYVVASPAGLALETAVLLAELRELVGEAIGALRRSS